MITLHGFSASNFYNVVKHVLLYKEIPFEENLVFPSGAEWLDISPVGKVPAITTEQGQPLSEASAICDYLDEVYPNKPLLPKDATERAINRQIMSVSELYLEVPARRLIFYHFSGQSGPELLQKEARSTIKRGLGAMQRLCKFSPYIAGKELTMADIYVHYVLAVVGQIGSRQLDWDIIGEVPGMREWRDKMKDTDIARAIEVDRAANVPEFGAYLQEYMKKPKA